LLRRLIAFLSFLAASAVVTSVGLGPAGAVDRPADDPVRGLVYSGLQRSDRNGACHGNFEVIGRRDRAGRAVCTHGPDPAPEGVDVRQRHEIRAPERSATPGATPAPAAGTAPSTGAVSCDGDGTSGDRVQLLYVHASNVADRYGSLTGSFQQWAANLDNVFDASAAETGGSRHVRFVHDGSCNAVVTDVTVSATGDDDFDNTFTELQAQGFTRSDRKYLAWVDATKYCGIAQVYYDDRPTPDNASNANPTTEGELARIDSGCWGQSNPVEAHELMHTLGGVQASAPHATSGNHCWDEYDRMCYKDDPAVTLQYLCPPAHERLFDCNHDDYYSTAPAPASYLATHWNTANNAFLIGAGSSSGVITTTTTVAAPPPTTTTTTRPPAPPPAVVPSAPVSLSANQPPTGPGVVLKWAPPANQGGSPVTGYKIYRGTSPNALSLLTSVGPRGYTDKAVTRNVLYYYQVVAVNAAGEGPRSNLTRMFSR
jgi:hypothetical protein